MIQRIDDSQITIVIARDRRLFDKWDSAQTSQSDFYVQLSLAQFLFESERSIFELSLNCKKTMIPPLWFCLPALNLQSLEVAACARARYYSVGIKQFFMSKASFN